MKTRQLIKQHPLLVLLYAIPLVVVANQLIRTTTSDLNRWKGGGFGMYTENYGSYRSIWLITEGADTVLRNKIYPVDLSDRAKMDPMMREIYRLLRPRIRNLHYYPSGQDYSSETYQHLKSLLLKRHQQITGKVPKEVRIDIGEFVFDLERSTVKNQIMKRQTL